MERDRRRDEHDSKKDLKRATQEALEGSNWRLMKGGIDYRLGFVSVRIWGLEGEEDLLKLIQKASKNETPDTPFLYCLICLIFPILDLDRGALDY